MSVNLNVITNTDLLVILGDSSEIKITDNFFLNFLWMFPTNHFFEK